MGPSRRVFHAHLFPVWEHWVVQVPAADDVHAIVLDPADAARVAQEAAALMLGVDPSTIRIVMRTRADRPARRRASSRRAAELTTVG